MSRVPFMRLDYVQRCVKCASVGYFVANYHYGDVDDEWLDVMCRTCGYSFAMECAS